MRLIILSRFHSGSVIQDDSYADIIGGGPDGKLWQLIFSADKKSIQKANQKQKGSGYYFPIAAAQVSLDTMSTLKLQSALNDLSPKQISTCWTASMHGLKALNCSHLLHMHWKLAGLRVYCQVCM